jgi:hypothetical protein
LEKAQINFDFILSQPDNEVKDLLAQINDVPVESSLRDITQGFALAYKIKYDNRTIGLEVCRVDINHLNQREFVILRCVKAPGYDLEVNFFDILDAGELALCKIWNCEIVRRHVDRAGMIPALEKYGYYVTEVVLKRRVKWEKEVPKVIQLHQAVRQMPISELPQVKAALQ